MKSLNRKLTSPLALFVLLLGTQVASAFYDPSLGRWLNRDPFAGSSPHGSGFFVAKLPVEVTQGANLYWPFQNNPVSNHDKDGRIVPLVCVIIVGVFVCGCSKAPPPPDQFDCWNPGHLPAPPGQSEQAACDLWNSSCQDCYAQKYFETPKGGDNNNYNACMAYCEQKKTGCNAGAKK